MEVHKVHNKYTSLLGATFSHFLTTPAYWSFARMEIVLIWRGGFRLGLSVEGHRRAWGVREARGPPGRRTCSGSHLLHAEDRYRRRLRWDKHTAAGRERQCSKQQNRCTAMMNHAEHPLKCTMITSHCFHINTRINTATVSKTRTSALMTNWIIPSYNFFLQTYTHMHILYIQWPQKVILKVWMDLDTKYQTYK